MDPWLITSMATVLVICALGLVGNSLCILILLQKEMRASYNFLLLGLGFSDLFLLVLSVIRTSSHLAAYSLDSPWIGLPIFFWDWICTGGTKYFTVAISMERYFVICHPLKAHHLITDTSAKLAAVSVFLFSVLVSIVSFVYNYLDPASFHIYVAIVLHFVPFFTVLILNLFIYFGLKSYQQKRKALTESESSDVSVTKMLMTVVIVFGLCYSFEFVRRILMFAGYFDPDKKYYDYTINHLADIFYVLNSSVNFVIYYLLGARFRNQFIKMFKSLFGGSNLQSKRNVTTASKTLLDSSETSQSQTSKMNLYKDNL